MREGRTALGELAITDDYGARSTIQQRYEALKPILDERLRRLWVAAEAVALGTGGISMLAGITGLSRTTIRSGMAELRNAGAELGLLAKEGRVRRPGGGRKAVEDLHKSLDDDLAELLESFQEGDRRALDWTCKSVRALAKELSVHGRHVSYRTVNNLLHRKGYHFSPIVNYKKFSIVNRRNQYHLVSRRCSWFLTRGEPVLSLVLFEKVAGEAEGGAKIVAPEPKSASLAASVLRYWWESSKAQNRFRENRFLLMTDTSGLPTGDRDIWVPALRELARDLAVEIVVAHVPPGARRWRKTVRAISCVLSPSALREPASELSIEVDQVLPPDAQGTVERARMSRTPAPQRTLEIFQDWNYIVTSRSDSISTEL